MDGFAKGLAIIAVASSLGACGGASAPSPVPTPPAAAVPEPAPSDSGTPAAPAPTPGSAPPSKVMMAFAAEPPFVAAGASAELVWSSPGAAACEASGGWSGSRAPAGRETSAPIVAATEFTLRCTGTAGIVERSVVVAPAPPVKVFDRHGRALGGGRELVLVDWDGQMANPAIEFRLAPDADAAFPLRVALASTERRMSFDKPSGTGESGPRKTLELIDASPVSVFANTFPDRDGDDASLTIAVTVTDATGARTEFALPVHEVDHDRHTREAFTIITDYSHDAEGYFADPEVRQTATDAARTWAYFIDDMSLDPVAAGAETTYIWTSHPDGYVEGFKTQNPYGYTGFLLYLYGFTSELGYSAAIASEFGGWQTRAGAELPLRRSGMVAIELTGTYDRLGWITSNGSEDWWGGWNDGADLFSTVVHEVGHALMLSAPIPKAKHYREVGHIDDEAVREYFGDYPRFTAKYHLADAVDPESLKTAWGSDTMGPMRNGRRLITKLDLLLLASVGYDLRPVSALAPLALGGAERLPAAHVGAPYAVALDPDGGIPFYDWEVVGGELPPGLELDRYDGILFGTPQTPGDYTVAIRVTDYPPRADTASRTFTLTVR